MNQRERRIKQQLESDGYRVLRGGAPDFMALKPTADGSIDLSQCKGVEVKSRRDKLTYEQEVFRKILIQAGIPYEVRIA